MPLLNSSTNFFLDLIFPIRCFGCGSFSKRYLCTECEKTVEFNSRFSCLFCNTPASYRQICLKCAKTRKLDQCLSAVSYKNPLINNLVSFHKYKFIKNISQDMSRILMTYLESLRNRGMIDFDRQSMCVIPVPLHLRRLRWRGFNQSELLARDIAKHFKVKAYENILWRARNNKPQAEVKLKKYRKKNIKNCFKCRISKNTKDKTVFLIDDIATTGSTLEECAKILKKSGAKRIVAITFARG